MVSLNRGHHLSLPVPDALCLENMGPKSGLETSNANDNQITRARKNVHFDPPNHGDSPPTRELIALLYPFVPLTTVAVAVNTQLRPICRRPEVFEYCGGYITMGGGGCLSISVFSFSFIYSRRGRAQLREVNKPRSRRGAHSHSFHLIVSVPAIKIPSMIWTPLQAR